MVTPRQARVLAGYNTMSEMASAMGLPVSTYISKESGLTSFSIKEGFRFAELCGMSFMDIDFLWTDRLIDVRQTDRKEETDDKDHSPDQEAE